MGNDNMLKSNYEKCLKYKYQLEQKNRNTKQSYAK